MKGSIFTVVLLVLGYSGNALAEGNCPDGYFPVGGGNAGWQGCAPMSGGGEGAASLPPDPGPTWATRYGAIAIDSNLGKFAGVDGFSSQRRAEKAALARCKTNGGKKCKLYGGYWNQCGALAWGDGYAQSYRAPTAEEAGNGAMRSCSAKAANCDVYFSGCSYPERTR